MKSLEDQIVEYFISDPDYIQGDIEYNSKIFVDWMFKRKKILDELESILQKEWWGEGIQEGGALRHKISYLDFKNLKLTELLRELKLGKILPN